ncbi:eukaryotic translation initiation factor 3 subunit J [Euwallacea fornicatus]|uniref:eukaryotic translation initiation factor 3 subunit J n=1 Tax=Euwallacea fornicatus TaxID=995702 RepID=UPI00338DDB80
MTDEASWDDENFEAPMVVPQLKSNKWVGEDEDDDVKESWEDEDDENKEDEDSEKKMEVKKPKKKTLDERIAEKEAKKKEELERRLKLDRDLTDEEKTRMQQESDLKLALETTFGDQGGEPEELGGLTLPSTKKEFNEFTSTLTKKLTPLSRHGNEYINFVEELTRNLSAVMQSSDIKKIKNNLDNLFLEKQKIEKGDKGKKSKGKGKAKLKMEGDNQLSAYVTDYSNDYGGEYDDFM